MKGRYQGCALPSGSQVTAAKVRDHINAGAFGQQGGLVQLHGIANAIKGPGLMPHGLTMGTDRPDLLSRYLRCVHKLLHQLGI